MSCLVQAQSLQVQRHLVLRLFAFILFTEVILGLKIYLHSIIMLYLDYATISNNINKLIYRPNEYDDDYIGSFLLFLIKVLLVVDESSEIECFLLPGETVILQNLLVLGQDFN